MACFRKAATDVNALLKSSPTSNESVWLIDLMDPSPSRRAYSDHLDPVCLGEAFGKQFSNDKFFAVMQEIAGYLNQTPVDDDQKKSKKGNHNNRQDSLIARRD